MAEDWKELLAEAASACLQQAEGEAEVKVGGRTIKVPAPVGLGAILELVPEGYIAVSLRDGSKLSDPYLIKPGERIALIPQKVDG